MTTEVADLFLTLRAVTAPFTEGLAKADAGVAEFTERLAALEKAQTAAIDRLAALNKEAKAAGTGMAETGKGAKAAADSMAAASKAADKAAVSLGAVKKESTGLGNGFTGAGKEAEDAESKIAKLGDRALGLGPIFDKVAKWGSLGLLGIGIEAVHLGSQFDAVTTQLVTQAGVGEAKLAGLRSGVLDLAGQVGLNPDSLAEALYHVESNFESLGISSQKALEITKVSAEGAAVGGADLVDVTNTLTAAVASGIPGVQDMGQAMGVLNAIVGAGDMKMQDLADAFGSGMVATVRGFGLSITDVGAALAVFGDNNIRGSLAGNQLRMSVMALAKPVSTATDTLKMLGLTQTTLADDMRTGGLKLALEDLVDRMNKAGISADKQGQVITDAFGRKAGVGLNVLVGQMDRLESKYPVLQAGANNFGDAWTRTQQTFSFQMKQLTSNLEALGISIGEKVIPYVQGFVKTLLDHKQATLDVLEATGLLLTAFAGFAAVSKTIDLFMGLKTAITAGMEAMTAFKLRMFEIQAANLAASGSMNSLGAAFGALGTKAKLAVAATGIGLAVVAVTQLTEISRKAPPDINRLNTSLEEFGRSGAVAGEISKTLGADLEKLGTAVDLVGRKQSGWDNFLEGVYKFLTLGTDKSKLGNAKEEIDAVDQSLANLVQSGHADLAAAAVKRLQDALVKQGKDPAELPGELNKYNDALNGVSLQQQLTADSMGKLGQQAVDTTKKLDDQKMTAEGLKQAISDLNDVNRKALDGMAGFEAAIDAASKAVQDNGDALHMVHGQLDLTNEKARNDEKALSDLAAKTDDAAQAALNSGQAMDQVNQIYDRGRQKLIAYAEQMGLNERDARSLADQILQTPDKTAQLKADESDLKAKLADAEQSLKNATGEKKVKLLADKQQLESDLADVENQLNSLHDRTVTVHIQTQTGGNGDQYQHGYSEGGIVQRFEDGGVIHAADGFTVPGYAPRRDVVRAMLSPGEGVLVPEAVRALGGAPAISTINRTARSRGTLPASAGTLTIPAAAPSTSGGDTHVHNTIHVHGSVLTQNDLRDLVQQLMLRQGAANSQTWQPFGRH